MTSKKPYKLKGKVALVLVGALTALSIGGAAQAKSVLLCSAVPFPVYSTVAFTQNGKFKSEGHWKFNPGQCRPFNGVSGNEFFVRSTSSAPVARYINDRANVVIGGWSMLCHDYKNRFSTNAKGKCSTKAGYQKVRLSGAPSQRYEIKAKNHEHLTASDAPLAERALTGRMNHEYGLKRRPGREAAFQIGASIKESPLGGIEVVEVAPGMPAEEEGIQVGDVITVLDGRSVKSPEDVIRILDGFSIFRSSAVSIEVLRHGEKMRGQILPLFYPFNHRDYREGGGVGAFAWEAADGAAFGFGNEVACGAGNTLKEGLSSLINGHDFDWKRVSRGTAGCSKTANQAHEKQRILYEDASNAGFWASFLVPGIPAAKVMKSGKAAKLAQRSRHVAPAQYGKGSLQ